MPPGVINSFVPGGASLKHPVMGLNWWAPVGFLRNKTAKLQYARIWRCKGDAKEMRKIDDEPVGIIATRHLTPDGIWVKVGWKWISSNSEDDIFVRGDVIDKSEYETDLAFELFKKLRVTNRPIRRWLKQHKIWIRWLNRIAVVFSATGCYQALAQSEAPGDVWFFVGALMAAHACITMLWMVLMVDGAAKK